jgi:hypothetical protein
MKLIIGIILSLAVLANCKVSKFVQEPCYKKSEIPLEGVK